MAVDTIRRPITVAEYFRMAEIGIIGPEERLELIEGELIVMPPPGPPHCGGTNRLNYLFSDRFRRRAVVQVQSTVIVSDISAPEPDLTLIRWDPAFLEATIAEPRDILLIVEVADSSRSFDRKIKTPLYARTGVREYWILDLVESVVEVHRQPCNGQYETVFRVGSGGRLAPEAFPDDGFAVDDLLHAPLSLR